MHDYPNDITREQFEIINFTIEISKRNEPHKFKVIAKRWIAERSLSWIENYHRLWKNYELKLHTSTSYQLKNVL